MLMPRYDGVKLSLLSAEDEVGGGRENLLPLGIVLLIVKTTLKRRQGGLSMTNYMGK